MTWGTNFPLRPESGKFVGRSAELAIFREAAEQAKSGSPRVVVIEGRAGMGKTLLLRQLYPILADFTVLWSSCTENRQDLPFHAVGQLVQPTKPSARFALLREETIPPGAAPTQVAGELLQLIGELQNKNPLAIIIDDIQWADAASVKALGFTVHRLLADQVLVILAARVDAPDNRVDDPENAVNDENSWRWTTSNMEQPQVISLTGLSSAEITELAHDFGARTLTPAAAEQLRQRTEGHPLYLRSVLTEIPAESLVDVDLMLPVPRSLNDTIRNTLTKLDSSSRALVEALAVLNSRVPETLAAQVAGIDDLEEAVRPLQAAGLIRRSPAEPSAHIRIQHALQRDAIYELISSARLRSLHAAAAPLVDPSTAWAHRVAAAEGADPDLAGELETEADLLIKAGNIERAATLLEWAAKLSDTREERERRLVTAAMHLLWSHKFVAASALMPTVQDCAPSPLRSCVLARAAMGRGSMPPPRLYTTTL